MSNETAKLIEVITDKLNPRYRKKIVPIPDTIIPTKILDLQELKSLNLRGLKVDPKRFETCNTGAETINKEEILKELPQITLGSLRSITLIDANTLACGGGDSKVTLIDISNRANLKKISSYMSLEPNIYELLTPNEWTLVNREGWEFDNDERLYRYARLYDPMSRKLVPYFDMKGDRVSRSEDGTRLVIRRR